MNKLFISTFLLITLLFSNSVIAKPAMNDSPQMPWHARDHELVVSRPLSPAWIMRIKVNKQCGKFRCNPIYISNCLNTDFIDAGSQVDCKLIAGAKEFRWYAEHGESAGTLQYINN